MNLGLIVEGKQDLVTYPHWIRKIRPEMERGDIRPRECKRKVKTKFLGLLKEFALNRAWPIQKAIVIADSDCNPPNLIVDDLRKRMGKFEPSYAVHFFPIRCKLETWLLADEVAINQVARSRQKQGQIARIEDPLESREAKQHFHRALSMVGLPADEMVYSEIAALSRIDVIRERCPQFREFERLVHAC